MRIVSIESFGWKRELNPDKSAKKPYIYVKRNKKGEPVAYEGDEIWERDNALCGVFPG